MIGGFLSGAEEESLKNLKGVQVRTFEFDAENQYQLEDLAALRTQLQSPEWKKVLEVESSEDGELVEMYVFSGQEGIDGFALISAEPREVTVVNVIGAVDLETLAQFGKKGIPKLIVPPDKK